MVCTQCGNEVELYARFCSKCGHEVAPSVATAAAHAPQKTEHDMNMHINILGWLLIGSGILTGLVATVLFFVSQMFGHLPFHISQQMPMGIPPLVSWITAVVGLGIMTLAAATAAAGVGLLQYRSWARVF